MLGVNGPADERFSVETLLALGVKMIRVPLRFQFDLMDFFARCQWHGVQTMLVGDSHPNSLGDFEEEWPIRIADADYRYGTFVDYYQWGNEADAARDAESSWVMSQERLNRLNTIAQRVQPNRQRVLAAMCSGWPGWLDGVDLSLIDAVACHPYAKDPGTQPLEDLLAGYLAYGKPVMVTEYDSRTPGMSTFLAQDTRLAFSLAFALHDDVTGFGMIDRDGNPRASYYEFQQAALGGVQHDTGGIDVTLNELLNNPGERTLEQLQQMAFMALAIPTPAPLNLGDANPAFSIYKNWKKNKDTWGTPLTREFPLSDVRLPDGSPAKALVTGRGKVLIWKGGDNIEAL